MLNSLPAKADSEVMHLRAIKATYYAAKPHKFLRLQMNFVAMCLFATLRVERQLLSEVNIKINKFECIPMFHDKLREKHERRIQDAHPANGCGWTEKPNPQERCQDIHPPLHV